MPTQNKYTEEELVALLQSKDESAFSYLYDHYAGALNGVIFKIIGESQMSEDILQEAFVKIWNKISSYDSSKGRLFTWMLNITRNLTIDHTRSKSFKKQSKILNVENSVDSVSDMDHQNVAASFDGIGLRKKVGLLKSDQKQIIDLAYFEGFTQDEISKRLLIPLGTVKTRMRSAIMSLRKVLN